MNTSFRLKKGAPAPVSPQSPRSPGGSKSYHYQLKVCLVGASGVGKTKLLKAEDKVLPRFEGLSKHNDEDGDAPPMYNSYGHRDQSRPESEFHGTPNGFPSVDFKFVDYYLENHTYRIQYWDCPGSDRYMNLTAKYCAGSSGFVLVFDLTDLKSFQSIQKWNDILDDVCDSVPRILVGNKDNCLSAPRQVSRSAAETFAKANDMHYYETDALSNIRCDVVFRDLFIQITEGIPPGSDPKDMIGRGVKLGPLLLSNRRKQGSNISLGGAKGNSASYSMDWL